MDVKEFARLGGMARAKKLTKARRIEIARQAGTASGTARKAAGRKRRAPHYGKGER